MCYVLVSLLLGLHQVPDGWQPLDARGVALTCLVNLPMVVRRLAPISVCVAICLLWAVFTSLDYWPGINSVTPLVSVYTVAATRSRSIALCCAALLGAVWNYTWYWGASHERSWVIVLGQSLLYPLMMYWFGDIARTSERRAIRLAELTERLRREREERARRAVAEERVRIARELHDMVAHHMAVISVQAGLAGYVFGSDPDVARGALSTIESTSTEALDEMRRLLSVLRVGPEGSPEGDGAAGTAISRRPVSTGWKRSWNGSAGRGRR
ncbi:histidine kinase dimerization/phosphoacceptor domain-containing protein [Streptomyces sp. M19]